MSSANVLKPGEKLAKVYFQRLGQPRHQIEARVPLAGFEAGDVGPVDRRLVGERLLGEAEAVPVDADPIPELDLPGRPPLVRTSHMARVIGLSLSGHPNPGNIS